MGARELLAELTGAGLVLTLTTDGLNAAPTSALTDEYRSEIRAYRSELMALLLGLAPACAGCNHLLKGGTCSEPVSAGLVQNFGIVWPPDKYGETCPAFSGKMPKPTETPISGNPYMSIASADRCHTPEWSEAEMVTFNNRSAKFVRIGLQPDADHLAEKLTLRDRDGDDRSLCFECQHYRPGRCSNHASAGLRGPELSRDLAGLLQRCPGFTS